MSEVGVMNEENLEGGLILLLNKNWSEKPGCDSDFHISHDMAIQC